jgi:hypothetical protein
LIALLWITACQTNENKSAETDRQVAKQIKSEFLRSWNAYKTYAWGHDALLPAYNTGTGIPAYWVNLKTGAIKGDTVNLAEGGSSLIEMGMLSKFTGNPIYLEKVKKASLAIHARRSAPGLVAENINVQTGQWVDSVSHIGCCIDSYYEYLYKGWLLFKDEDIRKAWDESIIAIQKYIAEEKDSSLWYGQVNMETGVKVNNVVTLYDAYFPAVLALSGDLENAARYQDSWNSLWLKYELEPMVYDYRKQEILHPAYNLNPEIIESAYYLYYFTGDDKYKKMALKYFEDIMSYCRTDVAFTNIKDIRTKEQKDHMETFFLAETMKYLYLVFANPEGINPEKCVFSTEAHPFWKSNH